MKHDPSYCLNHRCTLPHATPQPPAPEVITVTTTIVLPVETSRMIRAAASLWGDTDHTASSGEYFRGMVELIADSHPIPGIEDTEQKHDVIRKAIREQIMLERTR